MILKIAVNIAHQTHFLVMFRLTKQLVERNV